MSDGERTVFGPPPLRISPLPRRPGDEELERVRDSAYMAGLHDAYPKALERVMGEIAAARAARLRWLRRVAFVAINVGIGLLLSRYW